MVHFSGPHPTTLTALFGQGTLKVAEHYGGADFACVLGEGAAYLCFRILLVLLFHAFSAGK
jgi:hypothetical protein